MLKKLLHTPEGVRDLYDLECEKKLVLQNRLHHILKKYGFKDIQTPSFEFFDIFSEERGTISSKEMYKFFDREGNTLVLRPDFTPSIARSVAKYYKEEELPIRLSYMGSTFINNSSYQGKLKEVTQLGAELINDGTIDADAEMIAMAADCLLQTGLKEFQVEVGQADFFRGLMEEADFEDEEAEQLRILIENKNLFGVEELVNSKNMSPELKEVLLKLPELFGTVDVLAYARSMTKNKRALKALESLERLWDILESYGFKDYITFDLGMLSKYNYYTGIIFRAYTYGTGDAVITGGRYDNLLNQFGKNATAIGLAIVVDQLIIALSRQKVEIQVAQNNTLILYESTHRKNAIALANHFRKDDMNVDLLRKFSEKTVEDYLEYAKRNRIGGILYLEDEDCIQIIDGTDGSIKNVKISELL